MALTVSVYRICVYCFILHVLIQHLASTILAAAGYTSLTHDTSRVIIRMAYDIPTSKEHGHGSLHEP